MANTLLKLDGICLDVMGRSIVQDVSLEVQQKEIHGGQYAGAHHPTGGRGPGQQGPQAGAR